MPVTTVSKANSAVPPAASTEGSRQGSREQTARVLLAEDDYELRGSLGALLEADGFRVYSVAHGAAMLDFLASWILREESDPPVDVIVTDVRMPGFNGLNIVEGLRANGWRQPVVIISAFGDAVMRERVSTLGSAEFFDKPFDPCALERTILRCAGSTRKPSR